MSMKDQNELGDAASGPGASGVPSETDTASPSLTPPIAKDIRELGDGAKAFYRRLRTGDILFNAWASNDNPVRFDVVVNKRHRTGRFNSGHIIQTIRCDGSIGSHIIERRSRLAIVGHVEITETLYDWLRVSDHSRAEGGSSDQREESGTGDERGAQNEQTPKPH